MKLFDPLQGRKVVSLIPTANHVASVNGAALDISGCEGKVAFIRESGLCVGGTVKTQDTKIQQSADSGTTWTDVPNAAFGQVTDAAGNGREIIEISTAAVEGQIRVAAALGDGTSCAFGVLAIICEKYQEN